MLIRGNQRAWLAPRCLVSTQESHTFVKPSADVSGNYLCRLNVIQPIH